jgi:hypothetical protein
MLDSDCMGRDMHWQEYADNATYTRNIAEGKVHLIVGSIYSHNSM